jgi:hypothetical protein
MDTGEAPVVILQLMTELRGKTEWMNVKPSTLWSATLGEHPLFTPRAARFNPCTDSVLGIVIVREYAGEGFSQRFQYQDRDGVLLGPGLPEHNSDVHDRLSASASCEARRVSRRSIRVSIFHCNHAPRRIHWVLAAEGTLNVCQPTAERIQVLDALPPHPEQYV